MNSSCGKFGIILPFQCLSSMISFCEDSKGAEVGGLLAGHYSTNRNQAFISSVSGPAIDSRASRTWFVRGKIRLQNWLDNLWQKSQGYYVGEWHYHPDSSPHASTDDDSEMIRIANNSNYSCPEPVLIIIGGSADNWQISAQVYRATGRSITLLKT